MVQKAWGHESVRWRWGNDRTTHKSALVKSRAFAVVGAQRAVHARALAPRARPARVLALPRVLLDVLGHRREHRVVLLLRHLRVRHGFLRLVDALGRLVDNPFEVRVVDAHRVERALVLVERGQARGLVLALGTNNEVPIVSNPNPTTWRLRTLVAT